MRITRVEDEVELRMTVGEAERLAEAIYEGTTVGSRAEYWIRTGLSMPQIDALTTAIRDVVFQRATTTSSPLEPGVEEEEDPRRPRPDHH